MNSAFETFIQECGSVKNAAKVLGLDREHVSAMRRGLNSVNLIYALDDPLTLLIPSHVQNVSRLFAQEELQYERLKFS